MAAASRPNLLVMMSDQHNRAYMGCAGHAFLRTPALDRLAAEGMCFSNAYCAAPLCGPSRMSFLTCRMPSGNRVWSNGQVLSSAIPTWAHALGTAGYETFLFGRMDIRGYDQRHGFEHRPLGDHHTRHPGGPVPGGPLGGKLPKNAHGQTREAVLAAGRGETHRHRFDALVGKRVCQFLEGRARAGAARPFAAVAGFWLPHPPFVAHPDIFDYYRPLVRPMPTTPEETAAQPEIIRRLRRLQGFIDPIPSSTIANALAAYCGLCEFLDRQVGAILQALEETGLARDTVVIYTSDHGELAGAHGCWTKSNYYEGSVDVPLLVRWPGVVPAGRRCDAVCNLIDIGSTLVDVAGADPLPNVDGRSLLPWWRGETPAGWRQETFSELVDKIAWLPSAMIRSGRWKLWKYADELPPTLFDLEKDPPELNDLGASADHAEIRDALLKRLLEVWNPDRVARENEEQNSNVKVLRDWAKVVRPDHPDTPFVPTNWADGDIEMLS